MRTDEGPVWLNVEVLRKVQTETYLVMTLSSGALVGTRSEERKRAAGTEVGRINNSGWWSMALKPAHMGPAFNAIVRAKYLYGLSFVMMTKGMAAGDQRWMAAALKSLLNTSTRIHRTASRKMWAVLQWHELDQIVIREARGWITRWKSLAEREGKAARVVKEAILQMRGLRRPTPLKKSLDQIKDGTQESEAHKIGRWNEVTKTGDSRALAQLSPSRRPPKGARQGGSCRAG